MEYFVVSDNCPELFRAVKKIFEDSGIKTTMVIMTDLRKSGDKIKKNN